MNLDRSLGVSPLARTNYSFLEEASGKMLIERFGQKNVEQALIFISAACDTDGLRIIMKPTPIMVRDILEAVLGRPEPGTMFVTKRGTYDGL